MEVFVITGANVGYCSETISLLIDTCSTIRKNMLLLYINLKTQHKNMLYMGQYILITFYMHKHLQLMPMLMIGAGLEV